MQNEVEIILVGVEFLALRVIEDVLLDQRMQTEGGAHCGQVGWAAGTIDVGPACGVLACVLGQGERLGKPGFLQAVFIEIDQ